MMYILCKEPSLQRILLFIFFKFVLTDKCLSQSGSSNFLSELRKNSLLILDLHVRYVGSEAQKNKLSVVLRAPANVREKHCVVCHQRLVASQELANYLVLAFQYDYKSDYKFAIININMESPCIAWSSLMPCTITAARLSRVGTVSSLPLVYI